MGFYGLLYGELYFYLIVEDGTETWLNNYQYKRPNLWPSNRNGFVWRICLADLYAKSVRLDFRSAADCDCSACAPCARVLQASSGASPSDWTRRILHKTFPLQTEAIRLSLPWNVYLNVKFSLFTDSASREPFTICVNYKNKWVGMYSTQGGDNKVAMYV